VGGEKGGERREGKEGELRAGRGRRVQSRRGGVGDGAWDGMKETGANIGRNKKGNRWEESREPGGWKVVSVRVGGGENRGIIKRRGERWVRGRDVWGLRVWKAEDGEISRSGGECEGRRRGLREPSWAVMLFSGTIE